jgi:hypothetical protein
MPDDSSIPQFSTAQYSDQSSPEACKVCRQPITGAFYRANGSAVCGSCADRVKREMPQDNHARFVRGLLFGIGGFVAALIAYSLVGILLKGWTIGYLSLGVGWVVGKAMITGSGGVGGRRYQIVAVLLTYAAVSMSAIPIGLSLAWNQPEQTKQDKREAGKPSGPAAGAPEQQADAPPAETKADESNGKHTSLAGALGALALLGLASPFLELQDGFSGVIMLVILFVGMNFAWKMTAARGNVVISGPFEKSATASA